VLRVVQVGLDAIRHGSSPWRFLANIAATPLRDGYFKLANHRAKKRFRMELILNQQALIRLPGLGPA
jgi:hypothetical protein